MKETVSNGTLPENQAECSSKHSTQSLVLPAQFRSLESIRSFVARAAEECGLGASDVYGVQLAVDEAFTNIIEHAYGGECQENIQCTYRISPEDLTIMLRDCGRSFNPREIPEPDLESGLEERQVGGLGLYFIRKLMDEVEFTFVLESETGRECNIIKMVKRKERGN